MNKTNQHFQEVADVIKANESFAVIAHVNPDGDAVSSTVAMGLLLRKLEKKVVLWNEDTVPAKFMFLPHAEEIHHPSESNEDIQVIVALDCADFSRLGSSAQGTVANKILVNIDHHPTNDNYGKVNIIDSKAAATVQIIYELASFLEIMFDKPLATALYCGLLTDTGGFRYSNTTPDVMDMASDLISHGVSPSETAERLLETVSYSHIRLLQRSLKTLQISDNGLLCWLTVAQEDIQASGASPEDIDGIVNYPRNVEGVEVGICFKEVSSEEVKVSFRSREYVDVASIAKGLGGGGHARAAGCTVRKSMNAAIEEVLPLVKQALQRS